MTQKSVLRVILERPFLRSRRDQDQNSVVLQVGCDSTQANHEAFTHDRHPVLQRKLNARSEGGSQFQRTGKSMLLDALRAGTHRRGTFTSEVVQVGVEACMAQDRMNELYTIEMPIGVDAEDRTSSSNLRG